MFLGISVANTDPVGPASFYKIRFRVQKYWFRPHYLLVVVIDGWCWCLVGGGMMGGSRESVLAWHTAYYGTFRRYVRIVILAWHTAYYATFRRYVIRAWHTAYYASFKKYWPEIPHSTPYWFVILAWHTAYYATFRPLLYLGLKHRILCHIGTLSWPGISVVDRELLPGSGSGIIVPDPDPVKSERAYK